MTNDEKKKLEKLRELALQAGLRLVDDESPVDDTLPDGAHLGTWQKLRKPAPQREDDGTLKKPVVPYRSRFNTNTILESDPKYSNLVYWEMADQILLDGQMVEDAMLEKIAIDMEVRYRYSVTDQALKGAVLRVSHLRPHTPIKNYLDSLTWDGELRLANLAEEIWSAETTDATRPLIQEMSARMWIGYVARIYDPGCMNHTFVIYGGEKGVGKSYSLEVMAGAWFSRSDIPIGQKDAQVKIHQSGAWLWEIAEMKDLQGKSADLAKQFFSTSEDIYRPPYASMPVRRKRRTCFIGTTNNYQFMDDGPERRFWIFKLQKKVNIQYLRTHRDQIWAEAVHHYKNGVAWWLPAEFEEQLKDYQQSFLVEDAWSFQVKNCIVTKNGASIDEIMEFLDLPVVHRHTGNSRRIGQICRDLGYNVYWRGGKRIFK